MSSKSELNQRVEYILGDELDTLSIVSRLATDDEKAAPDLVATVNETLRVYATRWNSSRLSLIVDVAEEAQP